VCVCVRECPELNLSLAVEEDSFDLLAHSVRLHFATICDILKMSQNVENLRHFENVAKCREFATF
jgi:hypothetical protein